MIPPLSEGQKRVFECFLGFENASFVSFALSFRGTRNRISKIFLCDSSFVGRTKKSIRLILGIENASFVSFSLSFRGTRNRIM